MTPEKALSKAKTQMIFNNAVFLSTVLLSLKHEFTDQIPTAATDGKKIMYNPKFFMDLTEEERLGLLAHETQHVVFQHMVRGKGKDPRRYNWANDIVIDLLLHDWGFDVKKFGFYKQTQYKNWTSAEVYDDLETKQLQPPEGYSLDIIHVDNPEEAKQVEEDIKNIIIKAATVAKMSGDKSGMMPAELVRYVENLINPKLSYDQLLHRFMDSFTKNDYTWTRPNRRFFPKYYLPSNRIPSLGKITVAIDTSGSISKDELVEILSEVQYLYMRYKPEEMTLLACDTKIHNEYHIKPNEIHTIKELQFSGGGGTSFKPVIEYCKKNQTKILLYFTDLEASPIKEDPGYPIAWICYSNHAPALIGETIYYTRKP